MSKIYWLRNRKTREWTVGEKDGGRFPWSLPWSLIGNEEALPHETVKELFIIGPQAAPPTTIMRNTAPVTLAATPGQRTSNRVPIVGARHRPAGWAVLNSLTVGTPLIVVSEPTNPVDPNAIAVYVEVRHLSQETWTRIELLLRSDHLEVELTDIARASAWHIGYIAAAFAAKLQVQGFPGEAKGKFALSPKDLPRIILERTQREGG